MNELANLLVILALMAALLGAMAIRIAFEVWQYKTKAKEIISLFVQRGVVGPGSARLPEEMGLSLQYWSFGLRDYRAETLRALVQRNLILKTADGRLYLSPEAHQFYNRQGRA